MKLLNRKLYLAFTLRIYENFILKFILNLMRKINLWQLE